jgi:hypothetical protein
MDNNNTHEHITAEISALRTEIATLSRQAPRFESDELGELFGSLAKAQADMEMAKNDSKNPFFKSRYADLASVVKASRPVLAKNGLSVVHRVLPNGNGNQYLYSRLCHASGQWIESKMLIQPPKEDIQSLGSYLTYLRRYTYCALTGVVSSDEDDDGERMMTKAATAPQKREGLSRSEVELLSTELEDHPDMLDRLLNSKGITKLSDLPKSELKSTLAKVREFKAKLDTNG